MKHTKVVNVYDIDASHGIRTNVTYSLFESGNYSETHEYLSLAIDQLLKQIYSQFFLWGSIH